jgi:hypothetical protein
VRPLDAPRFCLRRARSTCEPPVELDQRSAIVPRESSSVVASCAIYSHPRMRFGRRSVLEASSLLARYEQPPHFWGDVSRRYRVQIMSTATEPCNPRVRLLLDFRRTARLVAPAAPFSFVHCRTLGKGGIHHACDRLDGALRLARTSSAAYRRGCATSRRQRAPSRSVRRGRGLPAGQDGWPRRCLRRAAGKSRAARRRHQGDGPGLSGRARDGDREARARGSVEALWRRCAADRGADAGLRPAGDPLRLPAPLRSHRRTLSGCRGTRLGRQSSALRRLLPRRGGGGAGWPRPLLAAHGRPCS